MTDSSLPHVFFKGRNQYWHSLPQKHHKCIVLNQTNKKRLTNAQEQAYISPITNYVKQSKPENTDLITLLQCKNHTVPGFLNNSSRCVYSTSKASQSPVPEVHGHYSQGTWIIPLLKRSRSNISFQSEGGYCSEGHMGPAGSSKHHPAAKGWGSQVCTYNGSHRSEENKANQKNTTATEKHPQLPNFLESTCTEQAKNLPATARPTRQRSAPHQPRTDLPSASAHVLHNHQSSASHFNRENVNLNTQSLYFTLVCLLTPLKHYYWQDN